MRLGLSLFVGALAALPHISCDTMLLGSDPSEPPHPANHQSRFLTVLDSIRYALDLPALAGAIVTDTGIVEAGAVGSRRYGGPANVTANDQFHLGSCGKSFTSVLLGVLVDEGKITWEAKLPEIYPELSASMRAEYREVTLRNLLSHSAGFMRDQTTELKTSTAREQRMEIVAWALQQPPVRPRGSYLYSNLDYIIAGAIAERVADRPYPELIVEKVLTPLGLTTAGMGTMGTEGLEDQPLQHTAAHAPIIASPGAHLHDTYDPAGGLYMSIGDWGKYCRWVLVAEAGDESLLSRATAAAITAPVVSSGDGGYYGFGWGVAFVNPWANGKSLGHSGSNGYNYSTAMLAVDRRFGVIVMTNQGAVGQSWLLGPAALRLIDYHLNGR
jgi:CubicO group peptidase (beta-lactamase class C family)